MHKHNDDDDEEEEEDEDEEEEEEEEEEEDEDDEDDEDADADDEEASTYNYRSANFPSHFSNGPFQCRVLSSRFPVAVGRPMMQVTTALYCKFYVLQSGSLTSLLRNASQ